MYGENPLRSPCPPGRAERERRDEHARTLDHALVDRVAQRDVDELRRADIAHRGEPRLERALRVDVRAHRRIDRAASKEIGVVVVALARQVRVHIDQPGEHRHVPEIDHGCSGRHRAAGCRRRDPAAVDDDHRIVDALARARLDEVRGAKHRSPGRRRGGRARRRPARTQRVGVAKAATTSVATRSGMAERVRVMD